MKKMAATSMLHEDVIGRAPENGGDSEEMCAEQLGEDQPSDVSHTRSNLESDGSRQEARKGERPLAASVKSYLV